jgi:hypothetical protein
MQRSTRYVPFWAVKFLLGVVVLLFAVALFAALVGAAVRGPSEFFDQLGKTITRIAPQPNADIRTEDHLKAVIRAMPDGELRVGSIVEEQDRVVFTITAERPAVRAAVRPGDELRISRTGEIEIVPTGLPGVMDRLQRALEDLRKQFFGGP